MANSKTKRSSAQVAALLLLPSAYSLFPYAASRRLLLFPFRHTDLKLHRNPVHADELHREAVLQLQRRLQLWHRGRTEPVWSRRACAERQRLATLSLRLDSGCTTLLNWEVEHYVASTGELVAHVLFASLATSTVIYMCYGNAAITTFQGGSTGAAWDTNSKGVWHLPDWHNAHRERLHVQRKQRHRDPPYPATAGQIDGAGSFSGSPGYIAVSRLADRRRRCQLDHLRLVEYDLLPAPAATLSTPSAPPPATTLPRSWISITARRFTRRLFTATT